jgi:hypothetical protein
MAELLWTQGLARCRGAARSTLKRRGAARLRESRRLPTGEAKPGTVEQTTVTGGRSREVHADKALRWRAPTSSPRALPQSKPGCSTHPTELKETVSRSGRRVGRGRQGPASTSSAPARLARSAAHRRSKRYAQRRRPLPAAARLSLPSLSSAPPRAAQRGLFRRRG